MSTLNFSEIEVLETHTSIGKLFPHHVWLLTIYMVLLILISILI